MEVGIKKGIGTVLGRIMVTYGAVNISDSLNLLLAAAYWLRKNLALNKNRDTVRKERTAEVFDSGRIRCPRCRWQPSKSSRWACVDYGDPEFYFNGCGTNWNTFETRGQCPGCRHRWQWTSCLQCQRMSRHEDWYANNGIGG